MFSPQFGDLNDDGIVDLISGADCCSSSSFYVFYGKPSGEFEERIRINFSSELPARWYAPGKSESRPFIVDWNQDGSKDVVILLRGSRQINEKDSDFVNEDFVERTYMVVNTDWKNVTDSEAAKFEFVDLGPNSPFPHDSDFAAGELGIKFNLAFVDHDSDGVFDMLFSASKRKDDGKIYFMRNLAQSGSPEFAPPKVIYDSLDKHIGWLATVDIDNDLVSEVAFGTKRGIQLLKRKPDSAMR